MQSELAAPLDLPVWVNEVAEPWAAMMTREQVDRVARAVRRESRQPRREAEFLAAWAPWQRMLRGRALTRLGGYRELPPQSLADGALAGRVCPLTLERATELQDAVVYARHGILHVAAWAELSRWWAANGTDPTFNEPLRLADLARLGRG